MLELGPGGVIVAPSILSADFGSLDAAIRSVAEESDWIHVDVMDGHFVPNLTIGPPVVASLRRHTPKKLDCHLMMTNPGDYLEVFHKSGADSCSVHVEVGDTSSLIAEARQLGLHVGLAVNPETPVDAILPYISDIDIILIMTVHPGFGGQHFMDEVVDKVRAAAGAVAVAGSHAIVEVDGGIDAETAVTTAAAGARAFVAGSAIFGEADPSVACRLIRKAAAGAIPV